MLVLLALLKRGVAKLSRLYDGTLPVRAQIKRAYTLMHIVRDVARIVILFVGVTIILSEGGIDLKPLLAVAGLGGLAIGLGVAYRESVDDVMWILQEIAEELRRDSRFADDILEPLEMLGVDQFTDSAVIIKCRIKTEPLKQWRVGREMNRRIKNTFDAKGIEIPFSHHTIYWGAPKKGTPQPA